jgi:hypothetical protein
MNYIEKKNHNLIFSQLSGLVAFHCAILKNSNIKNQRDLHVGDTFLSSLHELNIAKIFSKNVNNM